MFEFVIGCGQGGSRIAWEFSQSFEVPGAYMNLAGADFSKFPASRSNVLVIPAGGTGRNPTFGEEIARKNSADIREFLSNRRILDRSRYVLLCVGGGGGSGTGLMFPLLEHLVGKLKKEVLLIYTLPEKREGIPTKPNALMALDRLIENHISKEAARKISIMLIDNDFCVGRYGIDEEDGYDYWKRVNRGIVRALRRFWLMTNLENYKNYIDVTSGYKALDRNDVLRILFSKNGYTDVREMVFEDTSMEGLNKRIKSSSLVFGSLDIRTTKRYIVSIGVPDSWKEEDGILDFIESVFQAVAKSTKYTPDVVRCSYFNKKLSRIHVHLLLSGLAKSHGLEKIIKSAVKDVKRLRSKGDVERLDLSGFLS